MTCSRGCSNIREMVCMQSTWHLLMKPCGDDHSAPKQLAKIALVGYLSELDAWMETRWIKRCVWRYFRSFDHHSSFLWLLLLWSRRADFWTWIIYSLACLKSPQEERQVWKWMKYLKRKWSGYRWRISTVGILLNHVLSGQLQSMQTRFLPRLSMYTFKYDSAQRHYRRNVFD